MTPLPRNTRHKVTKGGGHGAALRCRFKGPALHSVACLRMAMCDDGQASYKEPWRCKTPLNTLIDTMPVVSHGRLVGLTQRLARTQMWFATANPTAGAPPSAQAIYADAWTEACTYVISNEKLLAGSALNDGLRKLKQAVDDWKAKRRMPELASIRLRLDPSWALRALEDGIL